VSCNCDTCHYRGLCTDTRADAARGECLRGIENAEGRRVLRSRLRARAVKTTKTTKTAKRSRK